MRRPLALLIVTGVFLAGGGTALAQYPPSPSPSPTVSQGPGCTAAQRAAFARAQANERRAFNADMRAARKAFKDNGPHTPQEKRAFAQAQREARQAFQRKQRLDRREFNESCLPSAATSLDTSPTITVGMVALVLGAGLVLMLIRRRRMASVTRQ
jgi:hypothetical protein